jgi:hypothetical protein
MTVPAYDEPMSNDNGTTKDGLLATKDITSAGDHNTLNKRLRLRIISPRFLREILV